MRHFHFCCVLLIAFVGCRPATDGSKSDAAAANGKQATASDSEKLQTHRDFDEALKHESKVIRELWKEAIAQTKRHEWRALEATMRQILEKKPKSAQLFEFMGWDFAYNVSAESLTASEKYAYIKKGIEFLVAGLRRDPTQPQLCWWVGIIIGDKIGQHDMRRDLRAMFAKDRELHRLLSGFVGIEKAKGHDGTPDNWLVAKLFFQKANEAVDAGRAQTRMFPLAFFRHVAKAQSMYAASLSADEGSNVVIRNAWKAALQDWTDLGERRFDTPKGKVRLNHPLEGRNPVDSRSQVALLRGIVNFDQWVSRCKLEQTDEFLKGRRRLVELLNFHSNSAPQPASADDYAVAFRQWSAIVNKHWQVFTLQEDETIEQLARLVRQFENQFKADEAVRKRPNPLREALLENRAKFPAIIDKYFSE